MNNTLGIEYAYARIHKLEVEALAYKDKIAELERIVYKFEADISEYERGAE